MYIRTIISQGLYWQLQNYNNAISYIKTVPSNYDAVLKDLLKTLESLIDLFSLLKEFIKVIALQHEEFLIMSVFRFGSYRVIFRLKLYRDEYLVNSDVKHSKKNYPLAPDEYSRHAQYCKMLLLLRSLNERALGTRIRDSQIYVFFHPSCPSEPIYSESKVETCILDINSWMTANKLELNNDKTKFLVLYARHCPPPQLSSIYAGSELIVATDSAKNPVNQQACELPFQNSFFVICIMDKLETVLA